MQAVNMYRQQQLRLAINYCEGKSILAPIICRLPKRLKIYRYVYLSAKTRTLKSQFLTTLASWAFQRRVVDLRQANKSKINGMNTKIKETFLAGKRPQ
jgi:hypothetical protein